MGFNNGYDSGYADALEDVRNGRIAGLGPTSSTPTPPGPTPPGPTPPGPTPTGPTVTAINDGTFHSGAGNVVTGANMRFADELPGDHVLIKNRTGDDMEAMISTDEGTPVTETRFALNIDEGSPMTDGEEYTFEFSMVDAEGEPVMVTQTARWRAS